jgi:hypothetical protein
MRITFNDIHAFIAPCHKVGQKYAAEFYEIVILCLQNN